MNSSLILIISLIVPAGFLWIYRYKPVATDRRNRTGPPRLPIIGNLLQIPRRRAWIRFFEWKKQYGDVIPLKVFGRNLIVLNSIEDAVELFEKRSAIYSERPIRNMATLCGFRKGILSREYGDRTRKTRRWMHSEIGRRNVPKHVDTQAREVHQFLQRIHRSPKTLQDDSRRLAASIILTISYSYKVDSLDDRFVHLAERVMGYIDKVISPNNYAVDYIPILKYVPEWFPGAQFKREARKCRNLLDSMMTEPYSMVQDQMKRGVAQPSLISRGLETELSEEDKDILMWTAGSLYAGGSHSTVAMLLSFFLTMIHYPLVQKKAQSELDNILSEGRLPKLTDRDSLPYIDCILQELMRWKPVTPIAAHSSSIDDVYKGIHIPAGSVVMANAWAYTHDEEIYDRPDDFIPERFLQPGVPDPRTMIFGFGRRDCPGIHLVDNLLWMVIASTLSVYDVLPEVDKDGEPVLPSTEYSTGLVSGPLPFECRIVPRFPNSLDLVSQAMASWE